MAYASSAMRACREPKSASEYTATVLIPISRHARMTRTAISPRLAMRIFSNIKETSDYKETRSQNQKQKGKATTYSPPPEGGHFMGKGTLHHYRKYYKVADSKFILF